MFTSSVGILSKKTVSLIGRAFCTKKKKMKKKGIGRGGRGEILMRGRHGWTVPVVDHLRFIFHPGICCFVEHFQN